jgi:hypothetical protein
MSEPHDIDPLHDPAVEPRERPQLTKVDERLRAERPIPRPAFRGALGRSLLAGLEPSGERLGRVRALVAAYAGSGLCLIAIAAVGVAGAGPFAS